jgi:hypothetical protein
MAAPMQSSIKCNQCNNIIDENKGIYDLNIDRSFCNMTCAYSYSLSTHSNLSAPPTTQNTQITFIPPPFPYSHPSPPLASAAPHPPPPVHTPPPPPAFAFPASVLMPAPPSPPSPPVTVPATVSVPAAAPSKPCTIPNETGICTYCERKETLTCINTQSLKFCSMNHLLRYGNGYAYSLIKASSTGVTINGTSYFGDSSYGFVLPYVHVKYK